MNWRYNTTLLYTIGNSKIWRYCIAPSDAHFLMTKPHSKYSNNKQWNIYRYKFLKQQPEIYSIKCFTWNWKIYYKLTKYI